jgi:hypothetical protein
MKNYLSIFAVLFVIFVGLACNASMTTANLSELKFGKNNKADPASTTFNTGEDIYALAVVANAPDSKYKLTWKITYENVKGKGKGDEVGTNTVDFEGSKQLWQSFSSPLPGEYKVEATLSDTDGKKIDSKSGTLTIKGDAPTMDTKTESDKAKSDDDK